MYHFLKPKSLSIYLLIFILSTCCSCSEEYDDSNWTPPSEEPAYDTQMVLAVLSTMENSLVTKSGMKELLLFNWENPNQPPRIMEINDPLAVTMLANQRIVLEEHKKQEDESHLDYIVIRNFSDNKEIKRWNIGKEWYCDHMANSKNGKYAVVHLVENYRFDRDDYGQHRIGVLDTDLDNIQWVSTFYRQDIGPMIENIAISEDGKHVAAVGAKDGGWILVADVLQQKILWQKVPHGPEVPIGEWTAGFNDVCFSPDGNYVYGADNLGVFCFETRTGKILSQWQGDDRFISVDASPDGRLVAAGTGPGGIVYIYEAKTGKLLREIKTGQYTNYGLAFSPDSKMLASSGVKKTTVKIWKMPE
jgi:WD40 repeat protein